MASSLVIYLLEIAVVIERALGDLNIFGPGLPRRTLRCGVMGTSRALPEFEVLFNVLFCSEDEELVDMQEGHERSVHAGMALWSLRFQSRPSWCWGEDRRGFRFQWSHGTPMLISGCVTSHSAR
jgi:hypothetical protein